VRIKNLEELKNKLRPYLKEYLELNDTVFEGNHLTCPCRSNHRNDDNTPSATFFPDDEHIKCFVCDDVSNADIFACAYFLEGKPLTGSEFISDNVLYLAKKFDISYKVEDISDREKQASQLREILEVANKMMKAVIKQEHSSLKKVKDYIKKRHWDKIIDKFEFGYCLYEKLIANLLKRGYTKEQLEMAGLTDKDNGRNQNSAKGVLNNRLVFPIRDGYGRITGFASRRLSDKNGEQKYINFRATNLYKKAEILYNLKEAKNHPKVYLVEGYADVWSLALKGVDNVIALGGLGFSDKQYDLLVYNRIKQLTLCLDNDEAGKEATTRIVEEKLKAKRDIEVFIKEPNGNKDPDEYLQRHSAEDFLGLPEFTIFEWKLKDLKENKENEFLKNDLIQLVVNEEDYVTTEQMIRDLAEVLNVTFETLKKEVERNRKLGSGKYLLTSRDILKEKASLETEVNQFESWAWSRGGGLLGLKTGYPILTKKLDGLQNAFYLLAGQTNIGKSAVLLNLALNLTKHNDVFVLFFSIDDNIRQILPRIIAADTNLEINTVANPKFKIKYNKELKPERAEELLKAREKAMTNLKSLSNSFAVKEENDIRSIEEMEKYIRIYKEIAGKKQLVVIVDNLHRIKSELRFGSVRETYMYVSDTLKRWKTDYDIPVVATAELKKINSLRRPLGDDIKECVDLQFDSDFTALLYNDFDLRDDSTLYFVDNNGKSQPVIEISVIKNKTGGFKGKLYYKFYKNFSKIVEASREEMEQYFSDFIGR